MLAALVLALPLPPHTRIDPDQARVPIRVSADGIVAATVTLADSSDAARVIVWNSAHESKLFAPPSHLDPGELAASLEIGGFNGAGMLYATLEKSMELEAGGNETVPGAYSASIFTPLDIAPCAPVAGSDFLPHIEQIVANGIYMTYESPDSQEVLEGDTTSAFAPYAVRLQGNSCTLLGRFSLRAVNGEYAVGFRGYFGEFIAPTDLNTDRQRYVAVRVHRGNVEELGPGVALAVAADGTAVGADAPAGVHQSESTTVNGRTETISCCTPHAMLWPSLGTPTALASSARESVAYAVDGDGTVAGMLVDSSGKHRAFIWRHATLTLLDGLVRAPGWRFEAAFAFGSHHEVIGIGTRNGNASLFEISL